MFITTTRFVEDPRVLAVIKRIKRIFYAECYDYKRIIRIGWRRKKSLAISFREIRKNIKQRAAKIRVIREIRGLKKRFIRCG